MRNKGFTLIELLAVIVILAIIALIAVPIILNIIKDTNDSANQRSVELYGKAVENAVAKAQLNNNNIEPGKLSDEFIETVESKGNEVKCTTKKLNTNGTVYLAGCKVGKDTKEYTYGEEEKSKEIYAYMWCTGETVSGPSIGGDASNLGTSLPANTNYYLKYKLDDTNKVTEAYVCAKFNGEETCVRGGGSDYYGYAENASEYTGNALILKGLQDEGLSCAFYEHNSYCYDGSVSLRANSNGSVHADDDDGYCDVSDGGSSICVG